MNEDLKWIKKKFGEKMMHLCRKNFPTIIEKKGLLPKILKENFAISHQLYFDIIDQNMIYSFRNFIYSKANIQNKTIETNKTPKELLEEAGYNFYECKTEEEIQSFKKYYAEGEELCTFEEKRLDRCYVFWAVKKNVNEIKRENFSIPQRQDEYGTSVISIQFTKDVYHSLSIKNRYNHKADNPDATFSNNLDNIIPGLTHAFEKTYGLIQSSLKEEEKDIVYDFGYNAIHPTTKSDCLNLENYVKANDGKLYRYNLVIDDIFYCQDNIIIDNDQVKKFDKESYLLFDNFIIDLKAKTIKTYDKNIKESFLERVQNIKNIDITKDKETKTITITKENNEVIEITLDKFGRMIYLKDENIKEANDNFLTENKYIKKLELPNLENIRNRFLTRNFYLKEIDFPNLKTIGDNFLYFNESVNEVNLPNLETVGNSFMQFNKKLQYLNLPNLKEVGNYFLNSNRIIDTFIAPNLETAGSGFLMYNQSLKEISLPNIISIGHNSLRYNEIMEKINMPNIKRVGSYFMQSNNELTNLSLPNLEIAGSGSFYSNEKINEVYLPNLKEVPYLFLYNLYKKYESIKISPKYKLQRGDSNFELILIDNNQNTNETNIPKKVG